MTDRLTALFALDAQRQRDATDRADRIMADARTLLVRQRPQADATAPAKDTPTRKVIRIERNRSQ